MAFRPLSLFLLCCIVCSIPNGVVSLDVAGTTSIEGRLFYPIVDKVTNEFIPYNVTTRITLNHGSDYMTYNRQDGTFTIRNIKPGVHVIDIHSVKYHFPQIKCQYKPDNEPAVTCLEYVYAGATKQPTDLPLKIFASATYEYFETRKGFSLAGIMKNPMFLMMAFSAGMMFLMPKLMEGMGEEEKAAMKKQMELQKDPTKMFGQLWGSMTGAEEEEASPGKLKKKTK